MGKNVTRSLQAIPPPPVFTDATGIKMELAGQGNGTVYMSAGPVTRKQFAAFLDAVNQRQGVADEPSSDSDAPVVGVSWSTPLVGICFG